MNPDRKSQNITDRRLAEEALRQAHADLEQAVANRTAELVSKNHLLIQAVEEHQLTVKALRESEEKYRGLVDNIGIGIAVIGPGMEILALNKQMKRWFPNIDISKKPICYKTFNTPPRESICDYCPTYNTLHDGQVHQSVTETPQKKGIRHYKIIASPIKDSCGNITAAIEMVEDITEHLKMQERLRDSEIRYRTIFETTGSATMIIEADTTLSLVNTEFEKLSGYAKEEIEGKMSWTAFVVEGDLAMMQRYHKLRRKDPEAAPRQYECRTRNRYGRTIDATEDLIPEHLKIVIFRILQEALSNITKHSRATLVDISLTQKEGRLDLNICDNGTGFDLDAVMIENKGDGGLGLTGMRERAELSGGRFKIESTKGEGTAIFASWLCDAP